MKELYWQFVDGGHEVAEKGELLAEYLGLWKAVPTVHVAAACRLRMRYLSGYGQIHSVF